MELTQKQSQKLSRTAAMLQSLELLQLPVCELASRLQDAALSNPLLGPELGRSQQRDTPCCAKPSAGTIYPAAEATTILWKILQVRIQKHFLSIWQPSCGSLSF